MAPGSGNGGEGAQEGAPGQGGPCPRAAQLEREMPHADGAEAGRLRRECAEAYLSCARSLLAGAAEEAGGGGGGGAGERDALECLEKAGAVHGLWDAGADACDQHAKALQKSGSYAGASMWFGHALSLASRAGGPEGQRARTKRHMRLRERCVECWEELVKSPVDDMDGPYRVALQADPSRPQTHIDMGYVLAGRGLADKAAECYERACGADPGSSEARFRAGTALEGAGQYRRATVRYAEAARVDAARSKRAAMGCAQCGRSLAEMGRRTEAAEALELAAALDPAYALECARAHERCAAAMQSKGGAGVQYESPLPGAQSESPLPGAQGGAAGSSGGGADAHYARASERYQEGGRSGAAEGAGGCARCGRALKERGRLAEAAAALDAAATLNPAYALECARAHEECAAAALRMGSKDEAALHYQRAAKWYAGPAADSGAGGGRGGRGAARRAPGRGGGGGGGGAGGGTIGDARGCLRCGRALGDMGMPEDAAAWIEAAATLDPSYALDCAKAHEECGLALWSGSRGRNDKAANHCARAVSWYKRAPAGGSAAAEAASGCARCGRALADRGRLAEAAEALEAAAGMDPAHALECAAVHERCAGEALRRRGGGAGESARHYAEAARWYRRTRPGHGQEKAAGGCARCGLALGEVGRLEEAAEAHAGAAVLDPSSAVEQARACLDAAGRARAGKGRGSTARILQLALECCGAGGGGPRRSPELCMATADVLLEQGRYAEAAAEYGRACAGDPSLRPRCGDGCVRCGDGLAGGSRIAEAIECIHGARAAGTIGTRECEDACVKWGRAMFDRSQYGAAAACFRAGEGEAEAGDGGGGWSASMLGLAASLSRDGRHAEAAGAYRRAQARAAGPDGPGQAGHAAEMSDSAGSCAAHLAIADALRAEGAHEEAVRWYARARAIGTGAERSSAYAGIARSLHARSMHASAHGCLAMSEAAGGAGGRAGDEGRLCADVGAGLEGRGLHTEAAECYAMAAERDPDAVPECAEACMRIGRELEKRRMRGEAVECYEAAARMAPGSHAAYFAIAGAMERGGNYNRAAWYYEKAGKCGGDGARAGAGVAMCRASDLHERARDEVDMPTKRRLYAEAEDAYVEAARLLPESPDPLIGAGKTCLKQRSDVDNLRRAEVYFADAAARGPRLAAPCLYAGKAVRKHAQGTRDRGRYRDALRHYDAAIERRPDRATVARYWRGFSMLCAGGGGDEEGAREFLRGVLDGAEPADSEEMHYCGRMCDILGRHDEAAEYYLGSLKGSRLYSADFYERIDKSMIRSGRAPERAADGAGKGDSPTASQFVCDTNVVIEYLGSLARETVFESPIVPMFEKGMCSVPQVCYNEAHGQLRDKEPLFGMLSDVIRPLCTVIKGRNRMDMRMQKAREAFMSAWLYSGEDKVRRWCRRADEKAGGKCTRYAGGPPSGRDVLVLATAIDMYVKQAKPADVKLVTWDRDFVAFGDYIRSETGVEVVRPEDMGR